MPWVTIGIQELFSGMFTEVVRDILCTGYLTQHLFSSDSFV